MQLSSKTLNYDWIEAKNMRDILNSMSVTTDKKANQSFVQYYKTSDVKEWS